MNGQATSVSRPSALSSRAAPSTTSTSKIFVVGAGLNVVLAEGAQALSIVSQVGRLVDVGAGADMDGVFLVKDGATFKTISSLNGHILAQTAVDLEMTTVTP